MTVKDLITQLTNLPLDSEVDIAVVGADPSGSGRDLHQFVAVDGWMVEHSSKGDHRRCCLVLKPVAKPGHLATLVDDYEDGTIFLPTLKRSESEAVTPKHERPAGMRHLPKPKPYNYNNFDHEQFMKQLEELRRKGLEQSQSQQDMNEYWSRYQQGYQAPPIKTFTVPLKVTRNSQPSGISTKDLDEVLRQHYMKTVGEWGRVPSSEQ